jgi:hypothetical protein
MRADVEDGTDDGPRQLGDVAETRLDIRKTRFQAAGLGLELPSGTAGGPAAARKVIGMLGEDGSLEKPAPGYWSLGRRDGCIVVG